MVSPVNTVRSSGTCTASWPGVWPGVWSRWKVWSPTRKVRSPGEDDGALVGVLVVDVTVGDQRRRFGVVGRDRLERVREWVQGGVRVHEVVVQALVVDHRHALEPVVAEDVVDVVLRVDEVADRTVRLGLRPHRDRARRELRRVDRDHPVGGRDEARVAAAQLGRRVDVGRDALELDGGGRHRYWVAVRPPSIPRIWPVTNEAASEQRKIAGPTMSRVSPTRPSGIRLTMPALNSGSASSDRDLRRVHEGRHDRVDPDAVLGPLGRPLAGEGIDRALGGHVRRVAGIDAEVAADR